jgi:hypothetical protein
MRSSVICGCIGLALPVLLTANGCGVTVGQLKTAAMASFVAAESCPAEQVTMEQTTRPAWLTAPPAPPVPAPPPEVAADPARLKVYNDEHAPPPDPYANCEVRLEPGCVWFLVGKGCGHEDVYACGYAYETAVVDPDTPRPRCTPVVPPATAGAR